MHRLRQSLARIYATLFLIYLLAPLLVMTGAAFNDSKLPSIVPWKGWTTRWFSEMAADERMMFAFVNTLWVAAAVFAVVNAPCVSVWLSSGVMLRRYLERPAVLRTFNIVMALLLVASLYPLFL